MKIQFSIEPQLGLLVYWGKNYHNKIYFGIDILFVNIHFNTKEK